MSASVSSPMWNYLDGLIFRPEAVNDANFASLTDTVNKIKNYLLNHEGWGQRALWLVDMDNWTLAYQAINDYAFTDLPYKHPVSNPMIYLYPPSEYKDLKERIKAFLIEMNTFHTEKRGILPGYWEEKIGELKGICRKINDSNRENKKVLDKNAEANANAIGW